ncbi:MAG: HIT family protein [Porticoccaceae bacterium]|nr:HIT family protein [Porticoccaceae bacterium]
MFELDSRLKNDTYVIGAWPLSAVLLHRDSNFPWCILVPRREGVTEIYQLNDLDQQALFEESRLLSRVMTTVFAPDKMNIAALGNVVKQLHIHHIARYVDDAVWPAPVWGAVVEKDYEDSNLRERVEVLRSELDGARGFI